MPTKTKKETVKKTPAKKKKSVAKKKAPAKKKSAHMLSVVVHEHDEQDASVLAPVERIIHRFEKRFVFVPSCTNCEHIPMRINRLVALMTVLVAVLSGIVISQGQAIDLTNILIKLAQI